MPTSFDVPLGLPVSNEGNRARDAITASFPDPADAARRFEQWGWRESVYCTFARPEGVAFDPTDVSLIDVSIHAFATEAGASAALPYLADAPIAIMGIGYAAVERLGDESLAVAGLRGDGVYEASIYLRLGTYVARISVVSPQGDPWDVTLSVAPTIADRQQA